MNKYYPFFVLIFLLTLFPSCIGQSNNTNKSKQNRQETNQGLVGGPFENREFMYLGMPEKIKSVDTSAGWTQKGQKLLITGKILKADGKTPAPDVIMYYYHTDTKGYYANKPELDKRVARHGYIRGWVKSDKNGNYSIYTVRPGSYPNSNSPAHIHPSIKEPNSINEYYIDEFVFDDDKLLNQTERNKLKNRGGSGILKVSNSGDMQIAEHTIILGLNIPNYPN